MVINDITGDSIITNPSNERYRDGYDRIFGSKKPLQEEALEEAPEKPAEESNSNEV